MRHIGSSGVIENCGGEKFSVFDKLTQNTKVNLKMSRCGECEEKLGQKAIQGDVVVCSNCKAKFHYDECSGVSASTWKSMGDTKRDLWTCVQRCRKSRTKSDKEKEEVITKKRKRKRRRRIGKRVRNMEMEGYLRRKKRIKKE